MAEVCSKVVKPQTTFKHMDTAGTETTVHTSYAALVGKAVDNEGRPLVDKATAFASYAWSYSWKVVLSALEGHARASSEHLYIFIVSVDRRVDLRTGLS